FSAHGLPKKIVAGGDPYQWQVEQTCEAVAAELGMANGDWAVCYQSQVGPLEWIGPSTDDEIRRAARDGVPVVVVPIAFVSEHSETLVELDIDYGNMARELGIPAYVRVPTVSVQDDFIGGLAEIVDAARKRDPGLRSAEGPRQCPAEHGKCPIGAG
ncbi:MAG: ferrochelatase, partial [Rhodospirillales bacterium]